MTLQPNAAPEAASMRDKAIAPLLQHVEDDFVKAHLRTNGIAAAGYGRPTDGDEEERVSPPLPESSSATSLGPESSRRSARSSSPAPPPPEVKKIFVNSEVYEMIMKAATELDELQNTLEEAGPSDAPKKKGSPWGRFAQIHRLVRGKPVKDQDGNLVLEPQSSMQGRRSGLAKQGSDALMERISMRMSMQSEAAELSPAAGQPSKASPTRRQGGNWMQILHPRLKPLKKPVEVPPSEADGGQPQPAVEGPAAAPAGEPGTEVAAAEPAPGDALPGPSSPKLAPKARQSMPGQEEEEEEEEEDERAHAAVVRVSKVKEKPLYEADASDPLSMAGGARKIDDRPAWEKYAPPPSAVAQLLQAGSTEFERGSTATSVLSGRSSGVGFYEDPPEEGTPGSPGSPSKRRAAAGQQQRHRGSPLKASRVENPFAQEQGVQEDEEESEEEEDKGPKWRTVPQAAAAPAAAAAAEPPQRLSGRMARVLDALGEAEGRDDEALLERLGDEAQGGEQATGEALERRLEAGERCESANSRRHGRRGRRRRKGRRRGKRATEGQGDSGSGSDDGHDLQESLRRRGRSVPGRKPPPLPLLWRPSGAAKKPEVKHEYISLPYVDPKPLGFIDTHVIKEKDKEKSKHGSWQPSGAMPVVDPGLRGFWSKDKPVDAHKLEKNASIKDLDHPRWRSAGTSSFLSRSQAAAREPPPPPDQPPSPSKLPHLASPRFRGAGEVGPWRSGTHVDSPRFTYVSPTCVDPTATGLGKNTTLRVASGSRPKHTLSDKIAPGLDQPPSLPLSRPIYERPWAETVHLTPASPSKSKALPLGQPPAKPVVREVYHFSEVRMVSTPPAAASRAAAAAAATAAPAGETDGVAADQPQRDASADGGDGDAEEEGPEEQTQDRESQEDAGEDEASVAGAHVGRSEGPLHGDDGADAEAMEENVMVYMEGAEGEEQVGVPLRMVTYRQAGQVTSVTLKITELEHLELLVLQESGLMPTDTTHLECTGTGMLGMPASLQTTPRPTAKHQGIHQHPGKAAGGGVYMTQRIYHQTRVSHPRALALLPRLAHPALAATGEAGGRQKRRSQTQQLQQLQHQQQQQQQQQEGEWEQQHQEGDSEQQPQQQQQQGWEDQDSQQRQQQQHQEDGSAPGGGGVSVSGVSDGGRASPSGERSSAHASSTTPDAALTESEASKPRARSGPVPSISTASTRSPNRIPRHAAAAPALGSARRRERNSGSAVVALSAALQGHRWSHPSALGPGAAAAAGVQARRDSPARTGASSWGGEQPPTGASATAAGLPFGAFSASSSSAAAPGVGEQLTTQQPLAAASAPLFGHASLDPSLLGPAGGSAAAGGPTLAAICVRPDDVRGSAPSSPVRQYGSGPASPSYRLQQPQQPTSPSYRLQQQPSSPTSYRLYHTSHTCTSPLSLPPVPTGLHGRMALRSQCDPMRIAMQQVRPPSFVKSLLTHDDPQLTSDQLPRLTDVRAISKSLDWDLINSPAKLQQQQQMQHEAFMSLPSVAATALAMGIPPTVAERRALAALTAEQAARDAERESAAIGRLATELRQHHDKLEADLQRQWAQHPVAAVVLQSPQDIAALAAAAAASHYGDGQSLTGDYFSKGRQLHGAGAGGAEMISFLLTSSIKNRPNGTPPPPGPPTFGSPSCYELGLPPMQADPL